MATASKGLNQLGNVSIYDNDINTAHKTGLWKNCPLLAYASNPSIGILHVEDFSDYNATDVWTLTQATAGAAAIGAAESGVLELDSNSTIATEGATLQANNRAFFLEAGKDLWYETKIKVVDTFDGAELFIGLSEVDTTLIAASANSSANHVGWQCVTDDGVLLFSAEKAGAGATKAAVTIAEDEYVTLGFYCLGVTSIQQYVNDVLTSTVHVTANIPIVKVVPSFVCQTAGDVDPILHVKGYKMFQLH